MCTLKFSFTRDNILRKHTFFSWKFRFWELYFLNTKLKTYTLYIAEPLLSCSSLYAHHMQMCMDIEIWFYRQYFEEKLYFSIQIHRFWKSDPLQTYPLYIDGILHTCLSPYADVYITKFSSGAIRALADQFKNYCNFHPPTIHFLVHCMKTIIKGPQRLCITPAYHIYW